MARRPRYQRSPKDFKPGRIAVWPEGKPLPEIVSNRVRYVASGEHKRYPSPEGHWNFDPKTDKAKCDRFDQQDWPRLQQSLVLAIRSGFVNMEFRGDFPSRVWVYINGVLHEARLTNEISGEYHGFPLEYIEQFPEDPDGLLRNIPRVTIPVI